MSKPETWDPQAKDRVVQWMVEIMASVDDYRTIVFGAVSQTGEIQTTWAYGKAGGSADSMGLIKCLERDLQRRWDEMDRADGSQG